MKLTEIITHKNAKFLCRNYISNILHLSWHVNSLYQKSLKVQIH
jgi:hypothetical protein